MWAEEGAPVLPVACRKLQLLFPQIWVFVLILLGVLAVGALGADTISDSPAASPYIYETDSPLAYDAASPSAYDAASPVSPSSDRAASPSAPDPITNATFTKLFELSQSLGPVIMSRFGFCMKDVQYDWDRAFNFTNDLSFLKKCIRDTKGEMSLRMCTAAEIKFYFASILESGSKDMKPNRNCNTSTWLNGCEPGWACSLDNNHLIDLKSSKQLPTRTKNCVPCCEGFFCPHGLTCMIPCPRGAYCPIGTLNKDSGYCDPYRYKLPQGQPNHTCGAADYWADIRSSREVFCPAGSYCPSTIGKLQCTEGHYCRTGSIDQQKCYRMTDCEPGSDNQNLTAYGVMLFGGLTVILVILYNCSDQVMSFRERRTAKSREAAARSARETALEARERLKGVKETAKKTAVGLQTSLSRTFSRKRSSVKEHDEKGPSHSKQGSETGLPPLHPTPSAAQPSTPSTQREQSNLAKIVREIDENPEAHDGFNVEIGDKSLGTNVNAKELNTRSQIFKYAYGQIEKEKALQEQNKNLTYSGVMSMGTDIELRKRSTIEVAFKDLTLTLKGKNRHLLRCVTGKISPGRVSAVMGPSGAGKTTFLSALTGKAPGCTVTGRILINGKADSIQSYKKIIGFVPQDDIVHGNLTVEENLWFSAQCRLPAGLPKAEKVLILERVIESLGLQAVRDSLVGTVEKRGISGGQRKRVNVGLEMVMEPSLLILDEPTSGLDSSSSQLLLRALRREALEGVNICMVVHQPSYTLYRMFDDLILLAKGGLLVYLGSVKKVEEYFGGLGIHVPDRVNPPDHYIDILEGIVKPPDLDYKELPLKWMLHNGYHVPHNLRNDLGVAETSEIENTTSNETSDEAAASSGGQSSLLRDFWSDLKCIILLKSDRVQTNMLRSLDLSKRDTPGIFIQYKYFLIRVGKQRLREAGIQAVDYLILLLAGACLGTIAKVSDETFGAVGYTYTVIAVSLLCKIAALRSFALDKLNYWRESGSGMSSLAYFLAKDTIDNFNTLIKPLVYLSMFYFFNNPRSSFWDNYLIMVCLVYCVTGIAYSFAVFFEPSSAQLWSVLLPVVMTLIATQDKNNPLLKTVENICYPKWALEAFILANAQRYYGVWLITRCGALFKKNYDVNDFAVCLYILIATGIISRIVAFNFMVIFKRK